MVSEKKSNRLRAMSRLFLTILIDFVIDLLKLGKSIFSGFVVILGATGFVIYGCEFAIFLIEFVFPYIITGPVVVLSARICAIIVAIAFVVYFFKKEFKKKQIYGDQGGK